jgi:hypothetical protein
MPAAALVGAVSEETISASPTDTSGVVFVALVAAIVLAFIFRMSRRSSVTADNVIDDLPVVELPVQQPEMVPA